MEPTAPISSGVSYSEGPVRPRSNSKKTLIIIVIIILLLIGGLLYFRNSQQQNEETQKKQAELIPTEEPTGAPEEEPTEEPTTGPTAAKSSPTPTRRPAGAVNAATDMNIQVLNGSGAEGVAGAAKSHLSGKGYTSLETGNADNFDYENVTVRIKASRKSFATKLISDLKEKYTVNSETGTVEDSSDYDALVIVGK